MGSAASHPLDVFCGNLTLIARQGHFSGHPEYAAEIARTFQILARRYEPGQRQRQQCNPVFLDAGGGDRWHAVEGAVAALVQGVAPAALHGRVILTLDFAGLMAGVDVQALVEQDQAIHARYPSAYRFTDLDRDAGLRTTLRRHLQACKEWERGNLAFPPFSLSIPCIASWAGPSALSL